MKVAIYARYSTDKQSKASIEDQFRLCRTYAKRQGWKVVGQYADREISGAKKDRPEFQRLIKDAEGGEFDVILVERLDRLSRNLSVMAGLGDLLKFYRCKIFTPNGEVSRMEIVFKGEMAQQALEEIAASTHRGLAGKVGEGKWPGGKCYGYETATDKHGNPVKGELRKVSQQAAVVKRIFSEFASGRGPKEIAVRLNADEVPSLRDGTWSAATIRAMLRNQLYIGRLVWGRSEWRRHPETALRVPEKRDEGKWVTKAMPRLRIVDDTLWKKVQQRIADMEAVQAERVRKRKNPKTRPGRSPKYLFSGVLKCSVCGGNFTKSGHAHFRCSTYQNRGPKACSNGIGVKQEDLEKKLLYSIRKELFDERSFERFKREARRVLQERLKNRNKDVTKLKRDLTKAEREIAGIVELAKLGKASPTLAAELEKAEAAKRRIEAELHTDLPAMTSVETLLENVLSRYARMAYSLEDFAARDVSKARNTIKALVGGQIILEPTKGGGLNARMRGDVGGLIKLVEEASPSGISGGGRSKVKALAGPRNHFCYNSLEIQI